MNDWKKKDGIEYWELTLPNLDIYMFQSHEDKNYYLGCREILDVVGIDLGSDLEKAKHLAVETMCQYTEVMAKSLNEYLNEKNKVDILIDAPPPPQKSRETIETEYLISKDWHRYFSNKDHQFFISPYTWNEIVTREKAMAIQKKRDVLGE